MSGGGCGRPCSTGRSDCRCCSSRARARLPRPSPPATGRPPPRLSRAYRPGCPSAKGRRPCTHPTCARPHAVSHCHPCHHEGQAVRIIMMTMVMAVAASGGGGRESGRTGLRSAGPSMSCHGGNSSAQSGSPARAEYGPESPSPHPTCRCNETPPQYWVQCVVVGQRGRRRKRACRQSAQERFVGCRE